MILSLLNPLSVIRVFLFACAFASTALHAGLVRDGHVAAELVVESQIIRPGQSVNAALRLVHDPHWHTYWINPGTGYPTSLTWKLPEGLSASEMKWPTPKVYNQAGIVNYVYEGETLLPFTITLSRDAPVASGESLSLAATADWLMCDEDSCVPGSADLVLQLTVGGGDSVAAASPHAWAIAGALRALPQPANGWQTTAYATGGSTGVILEIAPKIGTKHIPEGLYFFSLDGAIDAEAEQRFTAGEAGHSGVELTLSAAFSEPLERIRGVLYSANGWGSEVAGKGIFLDLLIGVSGSIGAALLTGNDAKVSSDVAVDLFQVIGLAYLGGLILNLMPCVFPVLGIKVMGFVNKAGQDALKVKLHGLVYTLGILISFWVLAGLLIFLRAGGQELGWGFQLQEPAFVFFLTLVLLLFGLNLSGVFEIGLSATGVGGDLAHKSGYSGSFFSGVLATVVSTPCAAPFLAPALGAALALAPLQSLLVFTSIGLGLASPYLLLSVFPSLVRFLPRPGNWMESFKQAMAFPMYGAAALLVWVMAGQISEDGLLFTLLALVMASVAAWIFGRWAQAGGGGKARVRWLGRACSALMLLLAVYLGYPRAPSDFWQEWSPERVEQLREQGKPIYVDFTARWCTTCRTNKAAVFQATDRVKKAFKQQGVVALKADWTNRDPLIAAALEEFGRAAVPLNLFYLPGAQEPVILPEILTPDAVLEALNSSKK